MRVRVIAIGSMGDVRPYVALGAGLRAAGHDVRIITHPAFESLVREHGLGHSTVAFDYRIVAKPFGEHPVRLQMFTMAKPGAPRAFKAPYTH